MTISTGDNFALPYSATDKLDTSRPSQMSNVDGTLKNEALVHNDKFWFYDGSIILRVHEMLFRIHMTVLSAHSPFFSDIFSLPQPSSESKETIEGCQVVVLHDNVDDVSDLLSALYDPSHFDSLPTNADLSETLLFVSGILRLSTKYLIDTLRKKCIALLQSKIPSTFAQYKASESSPNHRSLEALMAAVHLATETRVLTILPFTFYCISRKGSERILQDRSEDISWKAKATCLAGRERLRKAEMCLSHEFLLAFKPSSSCRDFCILSRAPHEEWHRIEQARHPDPLRMYTRWSKMKVCSACISQCFVQHETGRKEVWNLLPSWFGLASWENLQTAQNR